MQCKSEPSPLARGTLNEQNKSGELNPVHPRLRGELKDSEEVPMIVNGSSPLARGTRSNILTGMGLDAVHPRLRGELAIAALPRLFKTGSSPLARGTPTESAAIWTRARFIPACAGNSPMQFAEVVSDPVHPRLRGELSTFDSF